MSKQEALNDRLGLSEDCYQEMSFQEHFLDNKKDQNRRNHLSTHFPKYQHKARSLLCQFLLIPF